MKKLILIMAICGTAATLPAQVNPNPVKPYPDSTNYSVDSSSYQKPDRTIENDVNMNQTSVNSSTVTPQNDRDKDNMSIPEKVRTSFNNAYQSAKATWKKEGQNFKARFNNSDNNKLETVVVYDKDGNVIRTEKQLESSDYPSELSSYFKNKNTKSGSYKVWSVETKNGTRKYYAKHENQTTWFDSNGKHMSESEHHMAHHRSAK